MVALGLRFASLAPLGAVPQNASCPASLSSRNDSQDWLMNVLDFDILERPEFAILRARLQAGQKVFAEPSVMATMDPSIELKAGFKGGLLGSVGRAFAGESMVMNTFTAERGPGELMLAPGAAGEVIHQRLRGGSIFLQRGAYLANTDGVEVNAKWGG